MGVAAYTAMGFAVIHKYEGSMLARIPQLSQSPQGYSPKPSPCSQILVCEHEIQDEGLLFCSSKINPIWKAFGVNEEISIR